MSRDEKPIRAIYKADLSESSPLVTVLLFSATEDKFESFRSEIKDEVADLYEDWCGQARYEMFGSVDDVIKHHNEFGPDVFSKGFRKVASEDELIDFYSGTCGCAAIKTTDDTIEELLFEMGPIFGDNEENVIYDLLDQQAGDPLKVVEYSD